LEFTQEKCNACIRGEAAQLVQFSYNQGEIFVFWPRRGPSQRRERKRIPQVEVSKTSAFRVPELLDDEGGNADHQ